MDAKLYGGAQFMIIGKAIALNLGHCNGFPIHCSPCIGAHTIGVELYATTGAIGEDSDFDSIVIVVIMNE